MLIVGNGFDLAHGLPTKWENFKMYLESKISSDSENEYCSEDFKKILDSYIDDLDEFVFWSDVEGYLGAQGVECNQTNEIKKLQNFIEEFTMLFQHYLVQVEEQLFPKIQVNPETRDYLNSFDVILTTNYTNTLEKVYAIPSENVLHIHGQISEVSSTDITCIIGCDNVSFSDELFSDISPRKVGNIQRNNPEQICSTKISKLGITMSKFNTSEVMTENCLTYENGIDNIERLEYYQTFTDGDGNATSIKVYRNVTFWGYSFGESDYILNARINEAVGDMKRNPSEIKFISYSNEKNKQIYNEEIQKLIEDKLGYNSKYFKEMIDFSENYVEIQKDLRVS